MILLISYPDFKQFKSKILALLTCACYLRVRELFNSLPGSDNISSLQVTQPKNSFICFTIKNKELFPSYMQYNPMKIYSQVYPT